MKEDVVKSILETRIITIIRGFAPDVCLKLAEAYLKGGIGVVEVTFNQRDPSSWKNTAAAIKAIRERFPKELRVGAGTVLTLEQLGIMEDAGGEYAVSPNFNPAIIAECNRRGLASIPGAMTPSEVVGAYDAGATFVKLFPAGSLGADYFKALKAPLAHIPMLAVGGITPDTIGDFMRAGALGAGIGGNLSKKDWVDAGEWDKITDLARAFVENSRV